MKQLLGGITMKKIVYSLAALAAFTSSAVRADEITLRIGSGHPPGVVYAGLMINYFQKVLKHVPIIL
jgi:hypothetical protein